MTSLAQGLTGAGVFHKIEPVRIFLTGGTGFIGNHLVRLLLARGEEIIALVRDPARATWAKEKNVHLLQGDLLRIPALPSKIDIVYHLAGKTKAFQSAAYYTSNREGTASLFRALQGSGAAPRRVVFLSSLAAAGPSASGQGVREDDPPRPVTPYGRSKLEAEEITLQHKDRFPVVIVRATAIYGPGDMDFLDFFKWINRGLLPVTRVQKPVSLCYVKDLVEALDLCSRRDIVSGEIFNVADPRPYTWEELGSAAGRALGKRLIRVRIPIGFFYLAASLAELQSRLRRKPGIFNRDKFTDLKQPGWVANVDKARRLLSFVPRFTLEAGLEETMAWYREKNLL